MADSKGTQYRKNKFAVPVAGVFVVLAVIGFLTVAVFCVRFTMGFLDNSKEKQEFERILLPVTMFDPVPFNDIKDVDPLLLVRMSLWSTLLGDKRDSYVNDPDGRLMVPASDVEANCAKLFGPDIKLEHRPFGNIETTYDYDKETKMYYVPPTGEVNFYTPSVLQVVKKGNEYTLTVGYMPPLNVFTQLTADEQGRTEPEKKMTYKMIEVKDHFQLLSIEDKLDDDPNRVLVGASEGVSVSQSESASEGEPNEEASDASSDTSASAAA